MRQRLFLILLIAALLRVLNYTPYKIYPDSYQNLLVAQNLIKTHQIVSPLGLNGYLYPPYFSWTRPFYPLLISLGSLIYPEGDKVAIAISFLMGLGAVYLIYRLSLVLFDSVRLGLLSALLMSLSFSHAVWGGFILTETTAVFMATLFLLMVISRLHRPSRLAGHYDFLTGLVFGLAILTRYEYLVWLAPTTALIFAVSPKPWLKLVNIFIPSGFIVSLALPFLGKLPNPSLWLSAALALLATAVMLVLIDRYAVRLYRPIPFVIASLVVVCFYPGLREFLLSESLITLTFAVGIICCLSSKKYSVYGRYFLVCMASILILYFRANPAAGRYGTHLLPFLIVPAGYGLNWLLKPERRRLFPAILALGLFQLFLTAYGSYRWSGGAFKRLSYDEIVARKSLPFFKTKPAIIITAWPEPYYYFTGIPTQSLTDSPPYIPNLNLSGNTTVYLIADMALSELFPQFNRELAGYPFLTKTGTFWAGEAYRFGMQTLPESHPTIVYQTTWSEFISHTRP